MSSVPRSSQLPQELELLDDKAQDVQNITKGIIQILDRLPNQKFSIMNDLEFSPTAHSNSLSARYRSQTNQNLVLERKIEDSLHFAASQNTKLETTYCIIKNLVDLIQERDRYNMELEIRNANLKNQIVEVLAKEEKEKRKKQLEQQHGELLSELLQRSRRLRAKRRAVVATANSEENLEELQQKLVKSYPRKYEPSVIENSTSSSEEEEEEEDEDFEEEDNQEELDQPGGEDEMEVFDLNDSSFYGEDEQASPPPTEHVQQLSNSPQFSAYDRRRKSIVNIPELVLPRSPLLMNSPTIFNSPVSAGSVTPELFMRDVPNKNPKYRGNYHRRSNSWTQIT